MTPRMPDDMDYERLARFFAGECPPAEAAEIRSWIDADSTRQHQVEQLRRAWEAAGTTELRGDVDRGWANLWARMHEAPSAPERLRRAVPVLRLQPATLHRDSWPLATRVAAIFLAVALGAGAAWEYGRIQSASRAVAAQSAVMREVSTNRGQQANVYLSDGTRVVLGVASTLRFPTTFGDARNVELDGEAFFEIAHDEARSFLVHMPYGTARDIGTKFAVRAYRDMPAATVTVTEGSVVITPNARKGGSPSADASRRGDLPPVPALDSIIIGAMDVGSVSASGQLTVRRGAAAPANLAWMSGRLVFDQMPVAEAIAQINRWYDSDVRLGDSSLESLRLTASLGDESFERAIEVVATALDARITRRDSAVTLYRNTAGR